MDSELIRKAAEALWDAMGDSPALDSFDQLAPEVQKDFMRMAEAALKVFYEHTRAQTRERKPLLCPDCNGVMKPTLTNPQTMVCSNCGRSA